MAAEENEYEKERAARIRRNREQLARLQVSEVAAALAAPQRANLREQEARRKRLREEVDGQLKGPLRRSGRAAAAAASAKISSTVAPGTKRPARSASAAASDSEGVVDIDETSGSLEEADEFDIDLEAVDSKSARQSKDDTEYDPLDDLVPKETADGDAVDDTDGEATETDQHDNVAIGEDKHVDAAHKSQTRAAAEPPTDGPSPGGLVCLTTFSAEEVLALQLAGTDPNDVLLQQAIALSLANAEGPQQGTAASLARRAAESEAAAASGASPPSKSASKRRPGRQKAAGKPVKADRPPTPREMWDGFVMLSGGTASVTGYSLLQVMDMLRIETEDEQLIHSLLDHAAGVTGSSELNYESFQDLVRHYCGQ